MSASRSKVIRAGLGAERILRCRFSTLAFTRATGIELPIVCGAMYPCSNPELVAAASEAGGMGIVQPLSLVYVHG